MGEGTCTCQAGGDTLTVDAPVADDRALGMRMLRQRDNRAKLKLLTAAADAEGDWHAYLTAEGLQTSDGRAMAVESLTWRDLPLPLRASFADEGGHWGAVVVGSITSVERQEVGGLTLIYAEGTFDLEGVNGAEAARLCTAQLLRYVSIDLEVMASEWIYPMGYEDPFDDWFFWSQRNAVTAAAGEPYELITEGRIAGATMVDIPAFPQAVICPKSMTLDVVEPYGEAPDVLPGMIAAGFPVTPPAIWFDDPALPGPTPLIVDNSGRVYGHLATWGQCHTGYPGQCVVAPRSQNEYALFKQGTVEVEGGEKVRVGKITLAGGHANRTASWQQAAVHYDDTRSAVADINVGEDEFGVWVAGALRPDVTDEQVRTLRASPLSGDWRDLGGNLELIAALAVNVPGFPIVAAGMREGHQVSLVAAGALRRDPLAKLRERLQRVERMIDILAPDIIERLAADVVA